MLAQISHDLPELPRPVIRVRAHLPPVQQAVLRADRDDPQQRRLDRELAARRLRQTGAHDLRQQRAHLALPRLAGAQAGREPQPPLGQRREQLGLRLVAARKLQKVRRKHERTELVLPSRGADLVQLLARDEKHVPVHALVHMVGDGQRHMPRIHRDDLEFGVPVVRDEVAVVGLAAVQRGIDLERERQCAVLFFLSPCSVHICPPETP